MTETSPLPAYVGRYRILDQLGEGGTGVVYRGMDDQLGRHVAIKVPYDELIAAPRRLEAFLSEARILASLDHPSILPVHDIGHTPDGRCFLVTKLIEGTDLLVRMKQGALGRVEAVEIVARVAEALDHAHQHRLVHRDVKPANVLLDGQAQPLLIDFGLALREEEFGTGPRFVGTIPYMSPEQARREGHRVDGRTDIYSLGVVLYQLLTGRLPFESTSKAALLAMITTQEARPPREIDDSIPLELERICLKAMAPRISDRYGHARNMAEDLRRWQASLEEVASEAPQGGRSSKATFSPQARRLAAVVPHGLRAFDAADAGFFLDLLPGPRNSQGIPDSIAFLKALLEGEGNTGIGVVYGASGCGKTSLIKAGLLPRLDKRVVPVYMQATSDATEASLLRALRRRLPNLPPDADLVETMCALRRGRGRETGEKIVVVIDQFEQWLHAPRPAQEHVLVEALRQCDGGRLQALLLVRDEFWLALSRFLHALEVRLVEGENTALVDLFDVAHARKVLIEFGTAFGRLPADGSARTPDQDHFLEMASAGIAEGGKVSPVRLSLFAQMVQHKPWVPATLKAVGGAEGIGAVFLEETFGATTANAACRMHARAARAVLTSLLPEMGSDLKGHVRSQKELLHISGYEDRPEAFAELIELLDRQLRLVTPSDPQGQGTGVETGPSASAERDPHLQLTHDFLVGPIRDWASRKQRETWRGRAELRLEQRSRVWNSVPERQQLPVWWEWANILVGTRWRLWDDGQRRMMRAATRLHVRHAIMLAVIPAMLFVAAIFLVLALLQERREHRVDVVVRSIRDPEVSQKEWMIEELDNDPAAIEPRLRSVLDDATATPSEKLRVRLLLLHRDPHQVEGLLETLWKGTPEDVLAIRRALAPYREQVMPRLWQRLEAADNTPGERLRAAGALAGLDARDQRWLSLGEVVARAMLAQTTVSLGEWLDVLQPVRASLVPTLTQEFHHPEGRHQVRVVDALAYCAADRPDLLAGLLLDADEVQFNRLWSLVGVQHAPISELAERALDRSPHSDMSETDKDAFASRQAQAAIMLVLVGRPARVWPLLEHRSDPRLRTFLVHRFAALGVDPRVLLQRFPHATNASERRALILSLGTYPLNRFAAQKRESLLSRFLAMYRDSDDAGLRAAAEWSLRRWGTSQQLHAIDRELAAARPKAPEMREWYVNSEGQTLVVIPGPVEFWMGSPESEPDRRPNETLHRRRIDHSFAVASKDVTVEQFERFLRANSELKHSYPMNLSPNPQSSIINISWFDAARYCRWLSEREGVAEDQMCYPPLRDIKEGMKLPADFLSRTGYRLPTEAEWEYACRAGAVTSRFYGHSEALLPRYAGWDTKRTQTPGNSQPNDLGLFDIYGNVWEWCQDSYDAYPRAGKTEVVIDRVDPAPVVNTHNRVLRGGGFDSGPSNLRSAYRNWEQPLGTDVNVGMRLARRHR